MFQPSRLASLQRAVFIFVCGLIFALSYAVHSTLPDDVQGGTASLALFKASWPYKSRILSAFLAYKLVGPQWIDTRGFIFVMTLLLWYPCVMLFDAFARVLRTSDTTRPFLVPCFTLIMLAHFSLPTALNTYYIYDVPALLFYLVVVLLLIDPRPLVGITGAICATVFLLNRETIVIAVVHAFAIRASDLRAEANYSLRSLSRFFPIVLAAIGTMAMRKILLWALDGDAWALIVGPMYETVVPGFEKGDTLRIVANLYAIVGWWPYRLQLICIGFGALIYLPFAIPSLSSRARFALGFSVIPLVPLLILGNLTEIRIFTEFVPLMACALATCASGLMHKTR
jgi:hypothetical protein